MAFPRNEAETIELFRLLQNRFGWRIIKSQKNAFPDAVIENADGLRLNCEFEFKDKNFRKHGHPLDGSCDLIICWKAKWKMPPLPVWELSKCAAKEARILDSLLSGYIHKEELQPLNLEIAMLNREMKKRDKEIRKRDRELERLDDPDRRFTRISSDISCTVMACGIFFWGLYQLLDWLIRMF